MSTSDLVLPNKNLDVHGLLKKPNTIEGASSRGNSATVPQVSLENNNLLTSNSNATVSDFDQNQPFLRGSAPKILHNDCSQQTSDFHTPNNVSSSLQFGKRIAEKAVELAEKSISDVSTFLSIKNTKKWTTQLPKTIFANILFYGTSLGTTVGTTRVIPDYTEPVIRAREIIAPTDTNTSFHLSGEMAHTASAVVESPPPHLDERMLNSVKSNVEQKKAIILLHSHLKDKSLATCPGCMWPNDLSTNNPTCAKWFLNHTAQAITNPDSDPSFIRAAILYNCSPNT